MSGSLKPYSAYKHSGVAWLAQVPLHWDVRRSRFLFREVDERSQDGSETHLSMSQQLGLVPSSKVEKRTLVAESYCGGKLCEKDDLVLNRLKAHLGVFAKAKQAGVISPDYTVLRPLPSVNVGFFEATLRSPACRSELRVRAKGIVEGFWRLYTDDFYSITLPVPPAEEQAAIVRYLEHADRRARRYIRAKRSLIKLLDEQKQVIIRQTITGQLDARTGEPYPGYKDSGVEWLGRVPEHWDVRRLKWALRLQRGYDLPQEARRPGDVPVVSSGGVIGRHDQARACAPGIVMGRYGSTEAVFWLEEDYWPHNTALFTTTLNGNHARWCFYLLRSISKADHAGKSAVPGVDRKDLFDIKVVLPPLEEQAAIARFLDETSADLKAAKDRATRAIGLLREYHARLIADVVTGKLDVRAAAAKLPDEEGTNVDGDGRFLEEEQVERGDGDSVAIAEEALP